jgi:hypothetical protein
VKLCWQSDAVRRPTAREVADRLRVMLEAHPAVEGLAEGSEGVDLEVKDDSVLDEESPASLRDDDRPTAVVVLPESAIVPSKRFRLGRGKPLASKLRASIPGLRVLCAEWAVSARGDWMIAMTHDVCHVRVIEPILSGGA